MSSITRRLTSWHALILLVVLLLNGVAVYFGMQYLLFKEAKHEVQSVLQIIKGMTGPQDQSLDTPEIISAMGNNVYWVQITTSKGKVINSSSNVGKKAFAPNYIGPPIVKKIGEDDVVIGGAFIWKGIQVQVARPFEKEEHFLKRLAAVLMILTVLSLFFSTMSGRIIIKTALYPVAKLTQTTRRISSTDLSERIELSGPKDELYTLAETFNEMLNRLEKGYRSQQEFLLAASHDLRTPLAVIKSYTDVLNRWGKNEPAVIDESLIAIDKAVRIMDRLVNDLLILARFQTKPELKPALVDLGDLAEDVVIEAKSISGDITVTLNKHDSVQVEADEHYIRRAVWALVDNAIKYNKPHGEVLIEVRADFIKNEAILSVQDTGQGIGERELPQLFDRFYRGDPSRSQTKGFGLGLSLVKEIVEAHGGRVIVKSQVGEGSRFEMMLPLVS